MELLAKLGINWQLLLAQIVNFVIVLGVLTYFVYRPLLDLIDRRRERIAKAMEDAKRIEGQKKEMDALRVEQLKKIDQEAGEMLERAKKHAEATGKEILEAAHAEAREMLEKARRQLDEERAQALQEVHQTVSSVILQLTEKILEREFTPEDEKRITAALAKELPMLLR